MKRVDVFDFEDAACFASWLRASMTDVIDVIDVIVVIVVMEHAIGVAEALSQLVSRMLTQQRIDRIVDLPRAEQQVDIGREDSDVQRVQVVRTSDLR
jgi:hypothetical protein